MRSPSPKTPRFFLFFTILYCPYISSSHDTGANIRDGVISGKPVHQYITKEAGNAWVDLPTELSFHLTKPIDAPVDVACFANYDPDYDDIVTGSADEDQEWSPGCPLGPRYTRGYLEHFWDPDESNTGGGAAYDKGFSDDQIVLDLTGVGKFASAYHKTQEIWDRKIICYYVGRDKDDNTCPIDKSQAYYWLGRVAHLLEDMAVPSHVHNVPHNWLSGILLWTRTDPFEEYVGSRFSSYKGSNYIGKEYKHEDLPGIALQQGFQWADLHPNPTNLFKLYWYTAQKTQYYATGGAVLARAGDAGGYRKLNGKAAQFQPSLWEIEGIAPVGVSDDVPKKLREMADALVPHALRAVSGLYRLFWHETHPQSPSPVITGVLREVVESGELYVVPLVGYDGQTYWSAYVEGYNEDRVKADIARQRLAGVQDLWLYVKGTLVGNFRATGLKDFSEEGGPQIAFAGNVHWQSEPPADADRSHIIIDAVALSRPIPQPFWPKELHLSAQQALSLEDILHEMLLRAPSLLAKEAKQKKLDYNSFKLSIATAPKTSSVEVMDLDQDGQPDVYATITIIVALEGKGCGVQATVLATWIESWKVLKRSTHMSECPEFLTADDDHFTVSAVDLEGNRVGQLIVSEGRWESWSRTLYQVRNGQMIKKLDIGNYGS